MNKPFDMTLFLSRVLTGSKTTQQQHIRQARIMQAAIQQRWQRDNPWAWQLKHVRWFLIQHLKDHSSAARYYYQLTSQLIWKPLKSGLQGDQKQLFQFAKPAAHAKKIKPRLRKFE